MIGKRRLSQYKEICKTLGVKLIIRQKNSTKSPCWRLSSATIFINDGNDIRYIDSSFCHEVSHVLCVLFGIYPTFHGLNNVSKTDRLKAKLTHGITAERYVDKLAANLKKELKVGKHPYYFAYSSKKARNWYINRIKSQIDRLDH